MKQQDRLGQLRKKYQSVRPPLPKKQPSPPPPPKPVVPHITSQVNRPNPRRQCPSCRDFVGPAATYCPSCGLDLEKGPVTRWMSSRRMILLAVVVVVAYLFLAADDSERDLTSTLTGFMTSLQKEVMEFVQRLVPDSQKKKNVAPPQIAPKKPATSTTGPPARTTEKPPPPGLPPSESTSSRLVTREGYYAAFKKDSVLEAHRLAKAGDIATIRKMIENREVVRLKSGLQVVLEESGPGWVKVRIESSNTVFFTVPEAVGRESS